MHNSSKHFSFLGGTGKLSKTMIIDSLPLVFMFQGERNSNTDLLMSCKEYYQFIGRQNILHEQAPYQEGNSNI